MASLADRVKPALETLSTLLVIAAASALLWTLLVKQPSQAAAPATVEDVTDTIAKAHLTNSSGHGPLAIIEFADFQCPYCAKHAQENIPVLRQKLEGKARYIVMNLPLESIHPQAVPAAQAAECAAVQGKYWEMHGLLFTKRRELDSASADYVAYARTLGLDSAQFDRCLESEVALAKVKSDQALAKRLGANGTPTLFLGRMRSDGGVDLVKRFNGVVDVSMILAETQKL